MAPDREPVADGPQLESDGPTIDRAELYLIINRAVEDAILGALGTLLLVVVSLVLVWFGIMITISASDASVLGALGGALVTLVGLYFAGTALDLIPSLSDVR